MKDKMVLDALLLQVNKVYEEGDINSGIGLRFEIGDQTVRIFNKPGRKLITCTCRNGVLFCNEPTLCKHKISAILEFIKICK